jgi:cytoskeletal protein CcmA (bactofilin family)
MIFKKSNEWLQGQSTSNKNYMNAPRAPQQQPRREPEITPRTSAGTPQNNYPAASTQTATPVSPIATAQARRVPSPASRNDQLRKLTVGRDISLRGEITTCDHLVVEGTVQATIKGGKILEITDTGAFTGIVDIEQADIAGQFDGDLIVRGKLTIRPTAVVIGHIQYNRLQVDTGATINGELRALQQQAKTASPVHAAAATVADISDTPETIVENEDQERLFSFTAINDEPGFLKASA